MSEICFLTILDLYCIRGFIVQFSHHIFNLISKFSFLKYCSFPPALHFDYEHEQILKITGKIYL